MPKTPRTKAPTLSRTRLPMVASIVQARLTPTAVPANKTVTAIAGRIAGLARDVRSSEGKIPPVVLAQKKSQLRRLLADPRMVLKARPKTVSLPVWGSYLKAVREGRSATAGVKTPLLTRLIPQKTPVETKLPAAAAAVPSTMDSSFIVELTDYLGLLVTEAASPEPQVSSSAKEEIGEVLDTPDIAPLLVATETPAGVDSTVWTNFREVLDLARAEQQPEAPTMSFEPPPLPDDAAAPLLDMAPPPAAPTPEEALPPETTPVVPPVVEPPPPAAPDGWGSRLRSSVQNHPGAWAAGAIATGLIVWKGWSHFRGPKD